MRSEAARRTRKELTFIPVAKRRTRRRRRSIDWSIDIVGETTGASNTPGCSTATLFSSSAHPLVGLIKKPCEGERERRRTRSEYSERGEEEAYRRLTGPRRGQGSGRGTRAQRGGASRTTSSRSFLLFRGFGRGNERRARARERERERERERGAWSASDGTGDHAFVNAASPPTSTSSFLAKDELSRRKKSARPRSFAMAAKRRDRNLKWPRSPSPSPRSRSLRPGPRPVGGALYFLEHIQKRKRCCCFFPAKFSRHLAATQQAPGT